MEHDWLRPISCRVKVFHSCCRAALKVVHKRQRRQAWKLRLAQVTSGQCVDTHDSQRLDWCPASLFLGLGKWQQRRRPSGSWKRPNSALPAITFDSMLPRLPVAHRFHGDTWGTAFGSLKSKIGTPSVSSWMTLKASIGLITHI